MYLVTLEENTESYRKSFHFPRDSELFLHDTFQFPEDGRFQRRCQSVTDFTIGGIGRRRSVARSTGNLF